MKITDNAENEQLEKSQMTAIKVPYSQMEGEESNSVDSTQKSGVSTCNSNNSGTCNIFKNQSKIIFF